MKLNSLIIFLIMAMVSLSACKRTTEISVRLMNEAEKKMERESEEALALIDSINLSEVYGAKDKARYALLRTMAMDKNYFELSDSILQPAVDFYLKHGSPDQKMRTRYYQGVIDYQRKAYPEAMSHMLGAINESETYKDSLGMALVYAAQGSLYYKQYKIDDYIRSSKEALKIYETVDPANANVFPTYFKLINGANINGYPELADSIYEICKPKIGRSHPLYSRLTALRLVSLLTVKATEDVRQFVDSIDISLLTTPSQMIDLAWAYCELGESERSWSYICKAEKQQISDSLKYLAVKSEVLDSLGHYKESAMTYEQYLNLAMEEEDFLRRSELPYTTKNYEYQLQLAKSRLTKNRLIVSILSLLLLGISLSFYLYWRRQKDIQKFHNEIDGLRLEKDNLIARLEKEVVPENVKAVLRRRLDMLNTVISEEIRNVQYEKRSWKKLNALIHNDRNEFIKHTREAFTLSHPYFVHYLEGCGLTETEINLACLYALGLRGNEAGEIIGLKGHYNISAEIRKKLGLYDHPHSMNLSKYLQSLICKE